MKLSTTYTKTEPLLRKRHREALANNGIIKYIALVYNAGAFFMFGTKHFFANMN
jgi:hypothetical protein